MRTFFLKCVFTGIISMLFTCEKSFCGPKEFIPARSIIKWAVQKNSTLRITGKTNLAGFGCDIEGYYQTDTIMYCESGNPNQPVPLKGSLNIDVNNFDCHHNMLTNDLRKTLNAKEYPYLVIRFLALERLPVFEDNRDAIKGWVEIALAGVCKKFEIVYKLEKSGSIMLLNGARGFLFSDFNLKPPVRLGGMVKVKNDFNVDFKLMMHQVN